MSHIFLSYARPDLNEALALYDGISAAGYPVWLDKKALLVGQKWKDEISRAIQSAAAFIALISENSIDHSGYVQKEIKEALDVLAKTPSNQIYFLPVRLSDVQPTDLQLQDLHWLDLFPDRSRSMRDLLNAIATIRGLQRTTRDDQNDTTSKPVRKFTSMADIFRLVLAGIPPSTPESGAVNAFYLTARTTDDGLGLPKEILDRYPQEITFVFHGAYRDLVCGDSSFSVTLWFSQKEVRITVPYKAILAFEEREARIRIA